MRQHQSDGGARSRTAAGREFFAYGGDFGEELHDGNFVTDGLVFPDRTPSPGLVEFGKVIEPVHIVVADGRVTVRNRRDFADTADLRFEWVVETDGVADANGSLSVPVIRSGETASVAIPDRPARQRSGERRLTVRAVLAQDSSWAPAGHVVAWGQGLVEPAEDRARATRPEPVDRDDFDRATGRLLRLGGRPLLGPRLDVWRAPTDNDRGEIGGALDGPWRALGLDRMRHRTIDIGYEAGALVVRTRVAPAATDLGLLTTYRWTALADGALRLDLDVEPDGGWILPLPRLGLLLELPADIADVEWFGGGPGEAYADSRQAARIGRYSTSVDDLQTPYVYPQENGNRLDVRWARLTAADGAGLEVRGDPTFAFSARRWTSADLDAARHTIDLVACETVYLNVDVAQNGLGTASCGPGVLPQYDLLAQPVSFTCTFTPLSG